MTTAMAEPSSTTRSMLVGLRLPLLLVTGLVALADWLFWDNLIGITWPLFMLALGTAAYASRHGEIRPRDLGAGIAALGFAQIPGIEALDVLSALIGFVGTAVSVLIARRQFRDGMAAGLDATRSFLLRLPIGFIADVLRLARLVLRLKAKVERKEGLAAWIVPVVFTLVFLGLFSIANPLIEDWLEAVDLETWADAIDYARIAFWIAVIAATWPVVNARLKPIRRFRPAPDPIPKLPARSGVFGRTAIIRSLVLFNILFAIQTGLDLVYLWGRADLPSNIGYAAYAHRGAYTLIVTALLAAAFVLLATRDGSANRESTRIKILILLWTGQNFMLVLSSMRRLQLYVEAYDLTLWRVSALIWMVLVLAGIGLIAARILLDRPNAWLVATNLASLAAVLYVTSCSNLSAIVAGYNVDAVIANRGRALDAAYLVSLGTPAVPAIDRAIAELPSTNLGGGWYVHESSLGPSLIGSRRELATTHLERMSQWRLWSFRDWRLQRYLDSTTPVQLPISEVF